jgi:hypothetical protein
LVSILFIALAFLILIPALLFLPLGLTRRGAWMIALASLLLSAFGLLAKTMFPLWQMALFLLLLAAASTYLLDRKLGHLLYAASTTTSVEEEEEEPVFVAHEEEDTRSSEEDEQMDPEEMSVPSEEIPLEMWMDRSEPDTALTQSEQDGDEEVERLVEPEENSHFLFDELSSDEELEEWVNREVESVGDSSEYEQLAALTEPSELPLYEDLEEWSVPEEDALTFSDSISLEEKVEELERLEDGWEQDFAEQPIQQEQEPTNRTDVSYEPVTEQEWHDVEEKRESFAEEEQSHTQRQLIQTLVAQLQTMRKYMDGDEYEQLVREHLHPHLREQDYYTFATLLIEHYLASQQYAKLSQLLVELQEKWTRYPILQQQIQFLIEYVQQKMR